MAKNTTWDHHLTLFLFRLMSCIRLLQEHDNKSIQFLLSTGRDKWLYVIVHQLWLIPCQHWIPKVSTNQDKYGHFLLMEILNLNLQSCCLFHGNSVLSQCKSENFLLRTRLFGSLRGKFLIYICLDLTTEIKYSQMSLRLHKIAWFDDTQALLVVTPIRYSKEAHTWGFFVHI